MSTMIIEYQAASNEAQKTCQSISENEQGYNRVSEEGLNPLRERTIPEIVPVLHICAHVRQAVSRYRDCVRGSVADTFIVTLMGTRRLGAAALL